MGKKLVARCQTSEIEKDVNKMIGSEPVKEESSNCETQFATAIWWEAKRGVLT